MSNSSQKSKDNPKQQIQKTFKAISIELNYKVIQKATFGKNVLLKNTKSIFLKSTIHMAQFVHNLFVDDSLIQMNIYFNSYRQKSFSKTKSKNILSKRRIILLQTGKNCYPRQNLKLPYPNNYLQYCTLENKNPSNLHTGIGPPLGGPRLRARFPYKRTFRLFSL